MSLIQKLFVMKKKLIGFRIENYFLWSQGENNLPKWAKRNLNLWKSLNDNYEIQLLDSSILNKIYNEISFIVDYPIQTQADILRIYLLTKFRGV